MSTIKPYANEQGSKKEQVARMFNAIAPRYDFLNHFLSLGIDKGWRKKAIRLLKEKQVCLLLDVATGTGDFAVEAAVLPNIHIVGVDISEQMLEVGKVKVLKKKLSHIISLEMGDSENLRFADNTYDAITVAFGIRNFENLANGLKEMYRVLKPGGMLIVLEFSKPTKFPFKQVYNVYFKYILPLVGRMVSKDTSAYTYLPESVNQFPDGQLFVNELIKASFVECTHKALTFGVASIYTAGK